MKVSDAVSWPPPGAADTLPKRGNKLSRGLCGLVLRLMGWKILGAIPATKRLVVLVGPHTSNWDFIIGMLILNHLGLRMNFLIKDSVFKLGFGRFLSWLGAIPVDRDSPRGVYKAAMQGFKNNADGQLLVITPEGTRSNKTTVKEGFYVVAKRAEAQLMCCTMDYGQRQATLFPAFAIDGRSFEQIEQMISPQFAGVKGKHGWWMDRPPVDAGDGSVGENAT